MNCVLNKETEKLPIFKILILIVQNYALRFIDVTVFFYGICPTENKKAVFIILDGIPADVIEKVKTPNMNKIAAKGGYARAYVGGERGGISESPTISAVGYNSLLTGTWVNKHNVWGNSIKAPNYDYWNIFRIMRNARPNAKLGIYSTWLDNRTKLIGEGKPETDNLKMDFVFDGYELDTVNFRQLQLQKELLFWVTIKNIIG